MTKIKLTKGDKVIVLSGRDRGKTGVIERILTKEEAVLIPKLNIVKKHSKVTKDNPSGGILETERPIPISKVQLICPACDKPTRIKIEKNGKEKIRSCKKCGRGIQPKKESKKD